MPNSRIFWKIKVKKNMCIYIQFLFCTETKYLQAMSRKCSKFLSAPVHRQDVPRNSHKSLGDQALFLPPHNSVTLVKTLQFISFSFFLYRMRATSQWSPRPLGGLTFHDTWLRFWLGSSFVSLQIQSSEISLHLQWFYPWDSNTYYNHSQYYVRERAVRL